ncbi:extended synaptotagmin-3 [Nothobranchius furzeri]|uniref:Extended synaptotagmin-3 n=4 Tax=Nothobranchius TaxID=28779 RepID=A0A8C6L2G3_NOTFU|nr:extended synaptotagmin-3 [Nothobranchius furzeri]KAF7215050.1 extended synaptotagmin-3-like [Nothobranchius furzeri]
MASAAPTHPGGQAQGAGRGESSEALTPSAVNSMLMEFLIYFGRAIVVFYPVYLTGYLGLSISWVLLCMVMITWWKKNRVCKDERIGSAIDFVDNEKQLINTELKSTLQMATWVNFPDVEKVQWVNKILEQAWPFFGMFMDKLLKENIQPTIRLTNTALKMFTFTKIHFGHKPLRVTGMRAYTHEVDQREVILDLNLNFDSDVDIDANVNSAITAGIKGLKFQGMLRVILEPLVGQSPIVGGVTMFFIRRPTLDINWTGMTNLLDSPAFGSLSEDTIIDIIASLMVLPNRMCFPLISQIRVDQMRFPLPRGVVRVHVVEARDLVAKDTYMLGLVKGKSDPYTTLRVGNRFHKTKTIKENLHPKWNEVYEFVVHEAPGQELEVELYDEDTDKDDFLGRCNLDLGDVKREKEIDRWFPLEGVPHGDIHFKLQWFSLKTDPALLRESTDGLACAMLAVYLDNASNLPKDHSEVTANQKQGKHTREARLTKRNVGPNSYVELSVNKDVQKSKVVYSNKNPAWEQGFTFFVQSIRTQQLLVQVKEHEKKSVLGVTTIPLERLMDVSDMSLDQFFPLERSGAQSKIKLKATMRILNVEHPPPKVVDPSPPQAKQQKPPTQQGANTSTSTASPAPVPSSNTPHAASSGAASSSKPPSTPSQLADPQNLSDDGYLTPRRRSSFLAAESEKPSSALYMRRYDSQSLLSENSIASSRFDLSDGASYPEAVRNHQGSFGQINLSIRYITIRKKLIVEVNSCRNLFPCSANGTDSYVRLYLLPDHSWRHRKKTQVKKRTVNPVFHEKFEFDVSLKEAQTRKLDVSVKNNKMLYTKERKDIGMLMLDLSQMNLEGGIVEWFELTLPGLKRSM